MPTLAEVRQQYPQYNDLSDADLVQGLHRKFYADMPEQTFHDKIGYAPVDPLPARHIPDYAAEESREGLGRMAEGGRRLYEAFVHPKPPPGADASLKGAGEFALQAVTPSEPLRALGETAGGAVQYAMSYPSALLRGVVGEPARQAAEHVARSAGASPPTARMIGEFSGNLAETGAGFYAPELKLPGITRPRVPKVAEPPVMKEGVILSKGQATGDQAQLAFENRALRGLEGEEAQKAALASREAQEQQVAERTQAVRQSFDPQGRVLAETPREAGAIAQQEVQQQAKQADELTDTLFTKARSYDTQVGAGIFRGMGSAIRRDINEGEFPVIIDRALTPSANAMIADLNSQPEALARRLGQKIPEGQEIAALPLDMVDRIRRRLLGLRRGAQAAARAGRAEDLRASQAVIDAFDGRIDQAIDRGLYSGDPQGIEAWKEARAAHADYRTAFTRFSREPTSKTMEKVIGGGAGAPLIPEKVAEHIYGANILKPTTDNVAAAQRFKRMLDPEQWGAMQQGHYQKLLDSSPDNLKLADNIDTFLEHTMAKVIYPSQAQRDMLKGYAEMRRAVGSTATVGAPIQTQRMADRILQRFGGHIGQALGHGIGAGVGGMVGGPVGATIGGAAGGPLARLGVEKFVASRPAARAARRVERDMGAISNAWVDYAAAARVFEESKTARNIARLSLAARNLDRNLRSIGTNFQEMMQPAPQQPPAPPAAQRPPVMLPPGVMSGAPLSGAIQP